MLTLKRVQFGFDLPACFGTLATMFSPAPAALPVVGIANQQLYRRHCPEQTALYPVIEANLPAFLEHLQERDATLPRFVTDHVHSRAPPRMPPRRAESHPNLPDLFAER